MSTRADDQSEHPSDPEHQLVGLVGRVTVPIPEGGAGEVLLMVRGGSEAFAAHAAAPIPKHTQVVVIETTSARSVVVMPFP